MRLPNQAKPVIRTNGFIENIESDNVKLQVDGDCFRTFDCTGDTINNGRRFTRAHCERLKGKSFWFNGHCERIADPVIAG
ncbi:MAG: hypothetical protein N2645_00805 [Clostridia bacterium]|nr:hypothetical protein [Clostridia bacterium]